MAAMPDNGKKIKCVVIDAGHGGHDPGAVSNNKTKEKDITLSIALKLGGLIEKQHPNINVVYTRKTDVFVELHKRAAIANKNKADLFISIHCNSSKKSEPFGVETWVMGLHKSAANLEVAKKENSSILLEKNHSVKYDGFNPNSAEAYIIFSLFQNMYLNNSLILANSIQLNFKNKLKCYDRGIKQAGFLVLYKTSMPSVLVEVGFLSNNRDEKYLAKKEGQEAIVYSLYSSFVNYKNTIEGTNDDVAPTDNLLTFDQVKPDLDTTKIHKINKHRVDIDSLTVKFVDAKRVKTPKDDPKIDSSAIYKSNKRDSNEEIPAIVFRIQFLSSPTAKDINSKEFSLLENVYEYKHESSFKYTAGMFTSIKEAVVYQSKLQNIGYTDCFVVAFNKNIRISPSEATRLLNDQNNKIN